MQHRQQHIHLIAGLDNLIQHQHQRQEQRHSHKGDERLADVLFLFQHHIRTPLHLVGGLLTEQAGGLEHQNDDQQHEGECIGEGGETHLLGDGAIGHEDRIQALDDGLADADDERTHHRAGHGADAAEHGGHKRLQAGHSAGRGHHAGEVGEEEDRADGRQKRTDNKGGRDHVVDLDAHQLRRLEVHGHGAHGHADLGMVDEQHQRDDQRDGQERGDDRHAGRLHPEQPHRIGDPGDSGIVLVQAAGHIQRQILDQIADADGRDHNRHAGRGTQGLVRHPLDQKAQQHRQHDHQRDRQIQRHPCGEIDHHQAGHHEHIAVGEVDEPQYAIHHGVANGDQRILPAHRYAGYDIRQRGLCRL